MVQIKPMNLLRKLALIVVIFFGGWLVTAFFNPVHAEFSYCLQNKYLCRGSGEKNIDQLTLYRDLTTKEIIFLWVNLEDEDTLSLDPNASEEKISLSKEVRINHQDNEVTPKFLPLFLLESSFLL